jgi:hypothetical protein
MIGVDLGCKLSDGFPAPRRLGQQATANSDRRSAHVACNRPPPSGRSTSSPRSGLWTCRRLVSVRACPAPPKRRRRNADSQIIQRSRSHPSTGWSRSPGMGGRDQSERLVAINRKQRSQSAGARSLTEAPYTSENKMSVDKFKYVPRKVQASSPHNPLQPHSLLAEPLRF